jgi:hypothetical protein
MITISRGDGMQTKVKADAWQHDPYKAYIPVSARQYKRLIAWQAKSQSVEREDGAMWPTAGDPLRWGRYHAKVVLIIAPQGHCPHC